MAAAELKTVWKKLDGYPKKHVGFKSRVGKTVDKR